MWGQPTFAYHFDCKIHPPQVIGAPIIGAQGKFHTRFFCSITDSKIGVHNKRLVQKCDFGHVFLHPANDHLFDHLLWLAAFARDVHLYLLFFLDNRRIKVILGQRRRVHGSDPGAFYLNAWAAAQALANAVEKAGSTDYEALTKALKSEYVSTPLGDISFDERGDAIGVGFSVYQVRDGKFFKFTEVDMKKMYPDQWANKWIGWEV